MARDIIITPDVAERPDAGGLRPQAPGVDDIVDGAIGQIKGAAKADLESQDTGTSAGRGRGSFKLTDEDRAAAEAELAANEAPKTAEPTTAATPKKASRRGAFKLTDEDKAAAEAELKQQAGLAPSIDDIVDSEPSVGAAEEGPTEQAAIPEAPKPLEEAPIRAFDSFPKPDFSKKSEPFEGEQYSNKGQVGFVPPSRRKLRNLIKSMPEGDYNKVKSQMAKKAASSERRRSRPDASSAADRFSKRKGERDAKMASLWSNKGNVAVYDKLGTKASLNPNENSFGWNNYMEMVKAPGNGFFERMKKVTQLDEATLLDPKKIPTINKALRAAAERDPEGALFSFEKHPLTYTGDNVSIYLQLHQGRGILCHPAISKLMNADFDGDGAKIIMRYRNAEGLRMVSELFSGTGHKETIDEDFFPLPDATEDNVKAIVKRFNASPKQRARVKKALELKDYNLLGQIFTDIAENAKNNQSKINWNAGEMIGRLYNLGKIEAGEVVQFVKPPNVAESPIDRKEITSVPEEILADWVEKNLLPTAGLAVNVIELETMIRSNITWVPGKSHEFRVIANIGKYARKSDKIIDTKDGYYTIKDNEGLRALAYGLATEVYARAMSKQANYDQAVKAQKMILRNNIIFYNTEGVESELNPRNFKDKNTGRVNVEAFVAELVKRYEYWAAVVDSANVKVYGDHSVDEKRKWAVYEGKYDTSAIGKMIVNTFGHMTLDNLFYYCGFNDTMIPGWSRYKDMKIEDFVVSNPYNMSDCKYDPETGEKIPKDKGPYGGECLNWSIWFGGRNLYEKGDGLIKRAQPSKEAQSKYKKVALDGPVHPRDLFYIIADQKNLKAGEFSRDFEKSLTEAVKAIQSLRPRLGKNFATNPDDSNYADAILSAVKLLAPETFHHFGLKSTRDWLETDLGLKILKCNTTDQLKNCIYMAEYEMKISHVRDAWNRVADISPNDPNRQAKLEKAKNGYLSVVEALSSSSMAWSILANDFASLGSNWVNIADMAMDSTKDKKGSRRKLVSDPRGIEHFMYLNAAHIWSEASKWESFHDLMADPNVSAADKERVIADAVKIVYGQQMTERHVAYQLTRDKSSMFSESRYRDREGFSDLLVNIRQGYDDIQSAMRRDRDYRAEMEKQIFYLAGLDPKKDAGTVLKESQRNAVENKLNGLLEDIRNGRSLIQVNTGTVAATIASSLDACYPDTEKGKNANVLSACATAIALQKNGMLVPDWTIINDLRYGKVDYDTLMHSPMLLVTILASHEEFEVYTGNGSFTISYDILCKKGLLDFLEHNPRIFLAFSNQIANPTDDTDGGSAILESRLTVSQTIDTPESEFEKALNILDNHPGFYAMVAGVVDAHNLSSRDALTKYEQAITPVVKQLAVLATGSRANDRFYDGHIDLSFGERPESVSEKDWEQKCDRIRKHARDYAWELKNGLTSIELSRLAKVTQEDMFREDGKENQVITFFPNEQTMRAADRCEYQVCQALNAVSVGVNGSMTKEAVPAGVFYAVETEEDCLVEPTPVTVGEILEDTRRYLDMQAVDGTYVRNMDFLDLAEQNPKTVLYLRPPHKCGAIGKTCHKCSPWDGSSSRSDRTPVHPLALFFQLVRTDSSEALALKAGKVGYADPDDLIGDRVVRTQLLDEILQRTHEYRPASEIRQRLYEAYEAGGIESAREVLADDLMKICQNMGYISEEDGALTLKSMSYAQMLSVAKTMLVEGSDGLRLLSLKQIERTINSKLTADDLTDASSDVELAKYLTDYVDELAHAAPDNDIPKRLNNVKVSPRFFNLRHNERIMSSAPERNYELTLELLNGRKLPLVYDIAYLRKVQRRLKSALKKNGSYYKVSPLMKTEAIDRKASKLKSLCEDYTMYGFAFEGIESALAWSKMLPGQSSAILVTGEPKEGSAAISRIVNQAREIGVTVAFDADFMDTYRPGLEGNLSESLIYSDKYGCWMLPFFDMRLNGASGQVRPGSTSIGHKLIHPTRFVRMVLETAHEHDLGDSSMVRTRSFTDRFEVSTGGTHSTSFSDCFATLLNVQSNENMKPKFRLLSPEEGRLATIGGAATLPTIDLGVYNSDRPNEYFSSGYERWLHKLQTQSDEEMLKDVDAGDIVAWAELSWVSGDGGVYTALSPIRPFDRAESRSAPESYDISNISVDYSTAEVLVDYVVNRSFRDGDFFKAFEGNAAANKFVCSLLDQKPHRLANGEMVDVFTKAESTINRRGENLKKDCIATMIVEAKISPAFGYNIAESEFAFPNNPELKQVCLERPLSFDEWETLRDEHGIIRFYAPDGSHEVERMNALCNKIYRSCVAAGINPSIVFASKFASGSHNIHTIYHAILEGTDEFQADFMYWFNYMMPDICPSDPLDTSDGYMFTVNPEDGALETAVEYYNTDGSTYWARQHLVTSEMFFSDDISLTQRASIGESVGSPSSAYNMMLSGKHLDMNVIRNMCEWALSRYSGEIDVNPFVFSPDYNKVLEEFAREEFDMTVEGESLNPEGKKDTATKQVTYPSLGRMTNEEDLKKRIGQVKEWRLKRFDNPDELGFTEAYDLVRSKWDMLIMDTTFVLSKKYSQGDLDDLLVRSSDLESETMLELEDNLYNSSDTPIMRIKRDIESNIKQAMEQLKSEEA